MSVEFGQLSFNCPGSNRRKTEDGSIGQLSLQLSLPLFWLLRTMVLPSQPDFAWRRSLSVNCRPIIRDISENQPIDYDVGSWFYIPILLALRTERV